MELNKSDVPPVLLRYYADSGSTLSLSAYISAHYQIYREGLSPQAKFMSLAQWLQSFLPETYRNKGKHPEDAEVQRGQHL